MLVFSLHPQQGSELPVDGGGERGRGDVVAQEVRHSRGPLLRRGRGRGIMRHRGRLHLGPADHHLSEGEAGGMEKGKEGDHKAADSEPLLDGGGGQKRVRRSIMRLPERWKKERTFSSISPGPNAYIAPSLNIEAQAEQLVYQSQRGERGRFSPSMMHGGHDSASLR